MVEAFSLRYMVEAFSLQRLTLAATNAGVRRPGNEARYTVESLCRNTSISNYGQPHDAIQRLPMSEHAPT